MTHTAARILVVDDDARFRALVRHLLARAGMEVLEAALGEDALEVATASTPDGVILDVGLLDMDGFEVCRELRDLHGELLPIVFVSGRRLESHDRVAGLLIGGDDYLVKPIDPDELLARLRRLLVRSRPTNGKPHGGHPNGLTGRELEVLRLLAQGGDSRSIAEELVISEKTVASHLQHVMAKLGVRNRAQAVARAYEDGLLSTIAHVA